ncbi:MAG TPA: hypothetical protein DDZ69_00355, partial [Porphyromonadaceae bacterium]|nr:hypothetical protein [Porphyromonadaceae bacterium]HBU44705.1 hypothetical protein [Porphyromonadaceae bacterium]
MKIFTYIVLTTLLLLSCSTTERKETFQLLPEPKMLTIDLSGQHLLRLGVPDSSLVSEKLVNAIP